MKINEMIMNPQTPREWALVERIRELEAENAALRAEKEAWEKEPVVDIDITTEKNYNQIRHKEDRDLGGYLIASTFQPGTYRRIPKGGEGEQVYS